MHQADRVQALHSLAALYEGAHEAPLEALRIHRRILALEPDNLGAIHAIQRVTERAGRYQELVEALELEAQKTSDRDQLIAILSRLANLHEERRKDLPLGARRTYSPPQVLPVLRSASGSCFNPRRGTTGWLAAASPGLPCRAGDSPTRS